MSLRLGFISAAHARRRGDRIFTFPALARLIDAIAREAGSLSVALSSLAGHEGDPLDAELTEEVRFFPLPPMPDIARGMWKGAAVFRALAPLHAATDVSIVQLPFSAPTGLLPQTKPRVYHVCADVVGVVRASSFYRGRRRVAAVGAAYGMDAMQRVLIRQPRTRLVANGDALYEHYGGAPGHAAVSATLSAAEVDSVTRSRPRTPRRVLFVGYLRPEKGLDVLLSAYERLLERMPDLELRIVGMADATEQGAQAQLQREVERLQRRASVQLVGKRAFGPALFEELANADVLALPSRSEGTPRVLVEARAFRCPVVASDVGGVPTSVNDGVDGLLVPPGDPGALSAALERVLTDEGLRSRLIEAGLSRAQSTTVEVFARGLVDEARRACAES